MIEIRAATYDDLDGIICNLSDISLAEIEAFDVSDWKARQTMHACRKSLGCDVMVENGVPLCIFGAIRKSETKNGKTVTADVAQTWFVAAQPYFQHSRYLKESKRYWKKASKRHSHLTFESITASPHVRVEKWFKLLGFELTQDLDACRVFRYVGK